MFEYGKDSEEKLYPVETAAAGGVIEPERGTISKQFVFKWLIFLLFILYFLLTYFHAPILERIGGYLVVAHEPVKSDLAVCLAGGNIERGLETADVYKEGLVSRIFISREEIPDGYELLSGEGIIYPETVDLLKTLLEEAGVPGDSILTSDIQVSSTMAEAIVVRKIAEEEDIESIIIITSPHHTRRAWLTFKKVFEDTDMRLLMHPSKYSGFDPKGWWKKRKYVKDVIIEYQKLIFYWMNYLM